MRGVIEKEEIFHVYDDSGNSIYSTKIKIHKNLVYFDKAIDTRFINILRKTIPKGNILVCDYDQRFIDLGFKNPQVCKSGGICLYLESGDYDTQDKDKDNIIREYEFLSTQLTAEHCEIILKFNDTVLGDLQHLTADSKNGKKEFFGSFKIVDNIKDANNNIIHTLDIVPGSLISGSKDDVTAHPSVYNFHTHPVAAYKMYKVKFGPPSVQDYKSIYTLCKKHNTIVHLVASLEGIYVVYLLPDVTGSEKEILKTITKNFKYREKKTDLSSYIAVINSFRIFSVSMLPWTSPDLVTGIHIQFTKSGEWGTCKIRD